MSNISLKDFLIKYTTISEKFINEYFKFYLTKNGNSKTIKVKTEKV